MIIIISGVMASGKTTLAEEFKKRGYEKIITYTTRKPTSEDVDGVDYNFISDFLFEELIDEDYFIESTYHRTTFGNIYYGTAYRDYKKDNNNKVVILDPSGVRQIMEKKDGIDEYIIIFLDPSTQVLAERVLASENDPMEVARRYSEEKTEFMNFDILAHLIFHDESVEKIADTIEKYLNIREEMVE